MSRNTKIILAVVGGLFAVCCCLTVGAVLLVPTVVERFADGVSIDGEGEASDTGQAIVDYELPAGYVEEGGFELLGMKMVVIAPEDESGEMFMMLMQFPAGIPLNEEEMRQQMEQALTQSGRQRGNVSFEVVSTEQGEVNGEPAVFTTLEGTDENGNQIRQLTGIFTAKDGAGAMLMMMGNAASWDETAVNQFLASIRDDAGVGR